MSSSPTSGVSDRGAKKLEKLFVQEAKTEQKSIDHALKDVKEAEKALRKCMKTTEKAQKQAIKVKDKEHGAAKALNKAKHQHADTLDKEANAGDTLSRRREREADSERSVHQLYEDLGSCQQTLEANSVSACFHVIQALSHSPRSRAIC
ncbi:hypothetical protein C8Q80DRAFT_1099872 [Daedaleopsis nitida]|nr:hypothetical protein C8Q80DRAFT_1099872 [Daedaleopsis nitida]